MQIKKEEIKNPGKNFRAPYIISCP